MSSDADFFDLEPDGDGRFRFPVVDRLARIDGRLYGGTAIGVSVAAAARTTGHPTVWMTTQFVSTVEIGATLAVTVEVLAGGRRTSQVRVTSTSENGEVIFASLGATGLHRPDGLTGAFERMPDVSSPADSERWHSPFTGIVKAAGLPIDDLPGRTQGFGLAIEMAEPSVADHPDPGPGRICLWVRRRDRAPVTPAVAAYMADVVPMGVAHALGVVAGGTSLDNTIRIGPFVDSEWVLLDLRPHLAVGGYGHGIAHVWSEGGDLLATASQTASMIEFDLSHLKGLGGDQA